MLRSAIQNYVKRAELEIELIEEQCKLKKMEIRNDVEKFMLSNSEHMTLDDHCYYYWNTNFSMEYLKKVNTFSKKQIIEKGTNGICTDCGQETIIYPSSRSNLKMGTKYIICGDCKKKRENKQLLSIIEYRQDCEERQLLLEQLKSMPYKEYLCTEHWRKISYTAMKKANFKCQLCNDDKKLNVHHRTYERRGNELPTDLIVLCKNCHMKFHDILDGEGI